MRMCALKDVWDYEGVWTMRVCALKDVWTV